MAMIGELLLLLIAASYVGERIFLKRAPATFRRLAFQIGKRHTILLSEAAKQRLVTVVDVSRRPSTKASETLSTSAA